MWHVSISNLVVSPWAHYAARWEQQSPPLHHGDGDKVLTQPLSVEIRFVQCVIFSPVFLCYFSSVKCREVIAFVLSSQWETSIWCFRLTGPIQILTFVSSNVISNDYCLLPAFDCMTNRYASASHGMIVLCQEKTLRKDDVLISFNSLKLNWSQYGTCSEEGCCYCLYLDRRWVMVPWDFACMSQIFFTIWAHQ